MMTRACFIFFLCLPIACAGDTSVDDEDAGIEDGGPDADVCDTVECDCDTDEDCAALEVCDSVPMGRFCVCAPGYQGDGNGCVFVGAPLAPGFDDADPWTTSGGATLDPMAPGSDDPGEVRWPGNSICDGSSVFQTFPMAPADRVEPLAFEITYRGENLMFEARPQVGINEFWSRFPRRDEFFTQAVCLGEAGFGGDVEFRIDATSNFCPASDAPDELIVDRFEIVRAEDVGLECPDPGVVLDGDFEGDGSAWSAIGDASVVDGIGQDGTRGAQLRTATVCSTATFSGTVSLPLPSTLPSQALRFYWGGTPGRALQVFVADGFVAELIASGGGGSTSTICLPPHTRGLARSVTFSLPVTMGMCGSPDVRDFTVDSVEVMLEPACGDDPYVLDGDFELAESGLPINWRFSGVGERGSAAIVDGVAQSGNASLRFTAQQQCAFVSARTTVVVPKPDSTGGPAIKYFYQLGNNPETTLESRPGNGPLDEGTSGFVEETVCLDAELATQPLELTFTMQRSGPCGIAFPEEQGFIDNVRLTTDASCSNQ